MARQAYGLGFIADGDLYALVEETVLAYRRSITLEQFNSNVIDPIKLLFDAQVYGRTCEQIVETECMRQLDKSNTNHIGYFHQNLFRHVGLGWHVPSSGFDIVNEERHLFVELKNKHNTLNSSSALATRGRMEQKLLEDDRAVCMLVEVIASHSRDENWVLRGKSHRAIRRVSIDRFYSIAFGDVHPHAFASLCAALPVVLADVMRAQAVTSIRNTVLDELQRLPDASLLESLFRLAFAHYEGFDSFTLKTP